MEIKPAAGPVAKAPEEKPRVRAEPKPEEPKAREAAPEREPEPQQGKINLAV